MKFLEEIKYAAGKATLSLKRNAPTILMGAGVVGVVGSAVLACVATRKLDSILEEKIKRLIIFIESKKTKNYDNLENLQKKMLRKN